MQSITVEEIVEKACDYTEMGIENYEDTPENIIDAIIGIFGSTIAMYSSYNDNQPPQNYTEEADKKHESKFRNNRREFLNKLAATVAKWQREAE